MSGFFALLDDIATLAKLTLSTVDDTASIAVTSHRARNRLTACETDLTGGIVAPSGAPGQRAPRPEAGGRAGDDHDPITVCA